MWPFSRARKQAAQRAKSAALEPVWGFMRGDLSLESSEAIFAAVTRIASSMASCPVRLWRGYEEMKDDWRAELVGWRPSYKLSAYDLQAAWHTCCEATGNGYIFKVPGERGGIAALDVLNPSLVEPLLDRETGEVWYRMSPPDGPEMYVSGYDVLHIRHICVNGLKGINPVQVLRGALEYDDQIKEFSLTQAKGVNSCITLEIPSTIGDSKREKIIEQFLSNYRKSSGSLIVLDAGVKADVLTKSPVDSKVLDVDRITVNRVASVYNIPPKMLGDYGSGQSYNSNEQESLDYVKHTLLPRAARAEAELNRKLLTRDEWQRGYRFRYDLDALLRADAQTRANCDSIYIRSMIKKPDEVRADYQLAPVPGGDRLYGARDLCPIEELGMEAQHAEYGGA